MSRKPYIWLVPVVAHFGVVICGASGWLPSDERGPAARLLNGYGTLSGADSDYGFFAPVVGAPHRARFILEDPRGDTWHDTFERNSTAEARLRLTGIVDHAFMLGIAQEAPNWRQRLVKSWAAAMFSQHPTAVSLNVIVEGRDIPTMDEYRAGSRSAWVVIYQAEVRRSAVFKGVNDD